MERIKGSVILVGMFMTPASLLAQNLSTEIFPSEDELLQAFELGEISFEQFIRLQEIAILGVDSTTRFLFDEIPNLSFFAGDSISHIPRLQNEQRSGFERPPRATNGSVFVHFYQRIEEKGKGDQNRYRLGGDIWLSEKWRAVFRINREFSGRERWVRRTISYTSRDGFLRRLKYGNFSRRFGLGTIVGYRGKLVSPSTELSAESFLYPDYGGFNGLLVEVRKWRLDGGMLASLTRDREHSVLTFSTRAGARAGRLLPEVILGFNRIKDRSTGNVVDDFKFGLFSRYEYTEGHWSVEISGQALRSDGFAAAVAEGVHSFRGGRLRFAGWIYDNEFLDLASGSKSVSITRRFSVDEIDFELRSRRAGQKGAFARTSVPLARRWRLNNSLLIGGVNRDSVRAEVSSGLTSSLLDELDLEISYLGKFRTAVERGRGATIKQQQIRLTARFNRDRWNLRAYLAGNKRTTIGAFWSLLVVVRMNTRLKGNYELWSNLARVDRTGVDYWYVYLRAMQQLSRGLRGEVKFAHTFARSASDESRPVVSLRLEAAI